MFIAIVISESFAGRDEFERQNQVWGLLLDELSDNEIAQVAFVFTNTRAEAEEAERESASPV